MNMKKKVLCMSLAMAAVLAACAPKPQEGGNVDSTNPGNTTASEEYFVWNALDETAIEGYTELGMKQTELVIPAKCTSVLGLQDNTTVQKITFENPDTYIYSNAFVGCTALEEVVLPANLTELESGVFDSCESLASVVIPDSVTTIKDNVFLECSGLESVTLPDGLEVIGREAFSDCTALQEIVIPDSVTTIEECAFQRCEGLSSITFGAGLIEIENRAFEMCNSLKSVKLQEGVTTLGDAAFGLCASVEEFYMPASVGQAGTDALQQTHPVKVYVVEGSYMDSILDQMLGADMFEKLYQ